MIEIAENRWEAYVLKNVGEPLYPGKCYKDGYRDGTAAVRVELTECLEGASFARDMQDRAFELVEKRDAELTALRKSADRLAAAVEAEESRRRGTMSGDVFEALAAYRAACGGDV